MPLPPIELADAHLEEWRKSAVSDTITRLNVRTVTDSTEIKKLLNHQTERRWKRWEGGPGWWVSGVDPTTGMGTLDGGQFKPDTPYIPQGSAVKPCKYLGARGHDAYPLFLDTGDPQFWPRVLAGRDAIIITEGAKSAAAPLSQGIPSISLPGVWTAFQKGKGEFRPEFEQLLGLGRGIYLAFDADVMEKESVERALDRLGRHLEYKGVVVKILDWYSGNPDAPKGIDDWLATIPEGDRAAALDSAIAAAVSFEEWRKAMWQRRKDRELSAQASGELPPETQKTFVQEAFEALYGTTGPWICVGGSLHRWNGKFYERQPEEHETRRVANFLEHHVIWVDKKGGPSVPQTPYATPYHAKQVLDWAKTKTAIAADRINPPGGLNLENGFLAIVWRGDTPSWTLQPHDPQRLFTFCSAVRYDPDAAPYHCDRMLECLDTEAREVFLRTIAASLDLAKVRQKWGRSIRALLLQGTGSNGKDTLREAVSELYGRVGIAATSFADWYQYDTGRKFPISKLEGARISWSPENYSSRRLDELQGLKQAITGDTLSFESKGKDEREGVSGAVFVFNINDPPRISGGLEAIKSRYAILTFNKTFGDRDIPATGQLKAEPRFKYDPEWVRSSVLPAFLNRVLKALADLMVEGIEFNSTEEAFDAVRERTEHLYAFVREVGLVESPGTQLLLSDIWDRLESWYVEQGVLEIEVTGTGRTERIWYDQPNPYDKNIKARNQLPQRLQALFPKVQKKRLPRQGQTALVGLAFADQLPEPDTATTATTTTTEPPDGAIVGRY